ncbi:MAG: exodeoxyribonuclease VII large subunit [Clostridia bacterium]|nr:exodeoxyribonuclease VII large subunit [Clostridia bacterium]
MENTRRVATVSQINNYIKALLEQVSVIQNVWIKGEISNFKLHSSGHIYLTLKDSNSVLKAVMFRGAASKLNFKPKDGMMVLALGRIAVYEAGGQYQLYIEAMEQEGTGDLYAQFEELKKKLGDEGLFDEAHKKCIPKFPSCIGIATSPTGAAIRDMINVIKRRCPMVKIIIYPCLVQGDGASKTIVEAIEYFNSKKLVDVIIIGRGGGSIEDLWAFNEETTARAAYNSEIPVISAVGHETDFTISDFVSDLRAPTPSAAAELAVPDILELKNQIDTSCARMAALLKQKIDAPKKQLELLSAKTSKSNIEKYLLDLEQDIDRMSENLAKAFTNKIDLEQKRFEKEAGKLSALSPLSVFERGYCSLSKDDKIVADVKDVEKGDTVTLRLKGGELDCEVTERRISDEI